MINRFVFPVLYKTFLAFYEPCIDLEKIQIIKEPIIAYLCEQIVCGQLAKELRDLCRFSTLQEEISLANKVFANSERTLEQVGVDKLFVLDEHVGKIEGAQHTPYAGVIEHVKSINSDHFLRLSHVGQMDYILQISKLIVQAIDTYYDPAKPLSERFGISPDHAVNATIIEELDAQL